MLSLRSDQANAVAVPVMCGRTTHVLVVDGTHGAPTIRHLNHDADIEAAASAFGAEVTTCAQTEASIRGLAHALNVSLIEAGEWVAVGVSDSVQVAGWRNAKITPSASEAWRRAGCRVGTRAQDWIAVGALTPEVMVAWRDLGVANPTAVKPWVEIGLQTPDAVAQWYAVGERSFAQIAALVMRQISPEGRRRQIATENETKDRARRGMSNRRSRKVSRLNRATP